MTGDEIRTIKDLSTHAAIEAMKAASRVAELAPGYARPAILHHAAYHLTTLSAGSFAAAEGADIGNAGDTEHPRTMEIFRGIAKAWGLAPDTKAMDAVMLEVLNDAECIGGENG